MMNPSFCAAYSLGFSIIIMPLSNYVIVVVHRSSFIVHRSFAETQPRNVITRSRALHSRPHFAAFGFRLGYCSMSIELLVVLREAIDRVYIKVRRSCPHVRQSATSHGRIAIIRQDDHLFSHFLSP